MKFNKICLAYNSQRKASLELLEKYESVLNEIQIENIKLPLSMIEPFSLIPKQLEDVDLVIVFGGDGTLLTAARKFSQSNTPILGINVGHLGFLSEANNPANIKDFLIDILNGNYKTDIRTMLHGEIVRNPDESYESGSNFLLGLNDIVISRSSRSHILNINLEVDGSEIAQYMADGVIVCTPTGSTAYSLAAGGAVLDPSIQGIGVIPICAHSLTSRPLVISDTSSLKITITPRNRKQTLITVQADGQETFLLEPEDSVLIRKAEYSTKLIRSSSPENNFYKVLSKKLLWGRSR